MKEYKKTQYGFSVVEHYPDNKLYSIRNSQKDSVHHLVPEEIWDSLASAVERADNYRKSRDHFRESRDAEKAKSSEMLERFMANHNQLISDLNMENQFLMDEVNKMEQDIKIYKTILVFSILFSCICLLTHYLI
jgi:uncharacterized membrane protein YheB (UPF0754 family)